MKIKVILFLAFSVSSMFAFINCEAGGPLIVNKLGDRVIWQLPVIPFTPDQGPLGLFSHSEAINVTGELFKVWENVESSSVAFEQNGVLPQDITGDNIFEFLNDLDSDTSPIIFDDDGSVTDAVFGFSANRVTIGFAAPFNIALDEDGTRSHVENGWAVLNGRFFDGISSPSDMPEIDFKGTFVHEFGHYIGLNHTQVNAEQLFAFDPTDVPLMFPLAIEGMGITLKVDDIATVSTLYPAPSFASSTAAISGRVFLPDGISPFQGGNIIARNVSDPREKAYSSVSGFLHLDPDNQSDGGINDPQFLGFYEISGLEPGDYFLSVEQINPSFSDASGVGPLATPAAFPGVPEFYNGNETDRDIGECASMITVGAGQSVESIDIIINDPLFIGADVAEDESNDSFSQAQNIATIATVNGEVGRGNFIERDSRDVFRVNINSKKYLSLFLDSSSSADDLDLNLFDSNANTMGSSENTGPQSESIGPVELSPGTYFIEVTSFPLGESSGNSYKLVVVDSCDGIVGPEPTPDSTITPQPTNTPTPPNGKSFTFECENTVFDRVYGGIEVLNMELGDTVSCVLKLVNGDPNVSVKISKRLRAKLRQFVIIEQLNDVSDDKGEIGFNIKAVKEGISWFAWSVAKGEEKKSFSKESYDDGDAWGMYLRVK